MTTTTWDYNKLQPQKCDKFMNTTCWKFKEQPVCERLWDRGSPNKLPDTFDLESVRNNKFHKLTNGNTQLEFRSYLGQKKHEHMMSIRDDFKLLSIMIFIYLWSLRRVVRYDNSLKICTKDKRQMKNSKQTMWENKSPKKYEGKKQKQKIGSWWCVTQFPAIAQLFRVSMESSRRLGNEPECRCKPTLHIWQKQKQKKRQKNKNGIIIIICMRTQKRC